MYNFNIKETNENNLSLFNLLNSLNDWFAHGETELPTISYNKTGENITTQPFYLYTKNKSYVEYSIEELLDLIPYFSNFLYIKYNNEILWKNYK